MRALLLGLVLVAATAAPASAMGRYVDLRLIAWNADGTAALVTRVSSSSGSDGITSELILVGARGTVVPLVVSFDDTQDPDKRRQKIDRATCLSNAATLQRALASHRFRGVTIRRSHCKTDRQVVVVAPATWAQMEASHIGDLTQRPATTVLELTVEDALTKTLGAFPAEADVASKSGALILVFSGVNGDETGPAHAAVIARSPAGAQILVDDLR